MEADAQVAAVAALFDTVAADYDNNGVAYFGPIADQLIEAAAPTAGERAVDLGCGSGVVTSRLADAVGTTGSVLAVDNSPAMVARTAALLADRPQVQVIRGDAGAPDVPEGSVDLVTASLVIFFLPDPWAAISRWMGLVRPGGRVALTTFGTTAPDWAKAEALLRPFMPAFDPRVVGPDGPFASDANMERFLLDAGADRVVTTPFRVPAVFDDLDHWVRWSRSVGQRAAWDRMSPDQVEATIAAAADALEPTRGEDGRLHVWQDVRCTVGWRPED
ncbi:hypothetical protein GCM10028801_19780 [Nocardioides maradonensis]